MTRRRVFAVMMAALLIVLAVCLCSGAVSIYLRGVKARENGDALAWIYTREAVVSALKSIAPLFYALIGFGLAGAILGAWGNDAKLPGVDYAFLTDMRAGRRKLSPFIVAGWIVFAASMAYIAYYVARIERFSPDDLEGMFLGLLKHTLPPLTAGVAALALASRLHEASARREYQAALSRRERRAEMIAPAGRKNGAGVAALRVILLVAALCMIAMGVANGGMRDVLIKAINLCTECVGLG